MHIARPHRLLAAPTVVVAALLVLTAAPAWSASPPSADEIVREMKLALEPHRPSVRAMTLTFDDHGEKTTFGLAQARKHLPDGDRSLTVLLEPKDARGIAYLEAAKPSGGATEWLYVPYVRRTRQLVPAEDYQSFMDTDFTYGDLGLLPTDTRNKFLGTEKVDGKNAYEVESIPTSTVKQWYVSRTLTWIDAETLLPLRREFFSPGGDLFKTETFGSVARIDGVPTPLDIEMRTRDGGTITTLHVDSVSYDVVVPDALFAPDGLRTVAENDFWKSKPAKIAAP
jgi:hypothetical protein